MAYIVILRNVFSLNEVDEAIIYISNSLSLNISNLIIEGTNYFFNNLSLIHFSQTGGAIYLENVWKKIFLRLILKDNLSRKKAVGLRIFDNKQKTEDLLQQLVISLPFFVKLFSRL